MGVHLEIPCQAPPDERHSLRSPIPAQCHAASGPYTVRLRLSCRHLSITGVPPAPLTAQSLQGRSEHRFKDSATCCKRQRVTLHRGNRGSAADATEDVPGHALDALPSRCGRGGASAGPPAWHGQVTEVIEVSRAPSQEAPSVCRIVSSPPKVTSSVPPCESWEGEA